MNSDLDKTRLPVHIGIIMDGNGRWAKQRNKPRSFGHAEGIEVTKKIVKSASDLGIKFLTLYVFSTENWKRTTEEVSFLMTLIHNHLKQELEFYRQNRIRIKLLGDITGLSKTIQQDILDSEKMTDSFEGLTVCLAINYGGKDAILRSVKKIIENKEEASSVSDELISKYMDIPELPDADLIIRTGGEKRLSNFLMWQSAYSEFIFSDTLWPDYTKEELIQNIIDFQNRTRRFGAVLK